MKNWFNNLEKKYKVLIHVVLGSIFLLMPSFIGDNPNASECWNSWKIHGSAYVNTPYP